jgi:hypothetical protein
MASGPIDFRINDTALQNKFKRIKNLKAAVMPQLYQYFVNETPVRSGNARNNTKLDGYNIIRANYQYAGVLDAGRGFRDGQMRGSVQAPDGMTKPTKVEAQRLVNQYIQQYGRT